MDTQSHLLVELNKFAARCLHATAKPDERLVMRFTGSEYRPFYLMADIEAVLWLRLGSELGVFPLQASEELFETSKQHFLHSVEQLKISTISRYFPAELFSFVDQIKDNQSLMGATFAQRLSSEILNHRIVEMLVHEVAESFHDASLTVPTSFEEAWAIPDYDDLEPSLLLRDGNLDKGPLNRVVSIFRGYVAFLDHAGVLKQLFGYLDEASSSNFPVRELEKRVRAIHNWRLNLSDAEVRRRFEDVSNAFVSSVSRDDELVKISFDVEALIKRIESVCRFWTGDDKLTLNISAGEDNRQRRVA